MAFQIITDGSCDLGKRIASESQIGVVPFYVSFDGSTYQKEIEEIGVRAFYQEMVDHPNVFPKTSLPSVEDFVGAFTPYAEQGVDIICICITTHFSGSFNSALAASAMVKENYPDMRITVIDSTVNTVLQGILVLEAVRMKEDGLSYDEVVANVERIKSTGRILFTIGSMDYLVHGGRVGKLLGIAASTLGIKPLIMLKEGEIFPNGLARSRKKSKLKLIEQTKKYFEDTKESPDDYIVVVGYGYEYEEADDFRDALLASMRTYSKIPDIQIFQIGATIGVHTGPYPLGLGLLKRYDR